MRNKIYSKWLQTHAWDVTAKEAVAIQQSLREQLLLEDSFEPPEVVAGVDAGFPGDGNTIRAAVATLKFPSLEWLSSSVIHKPVLFPYIPGLLSFREVPAVLHALANLERLPDMILCDGQGYAHPRRLGIACHLGLITDIPTIGVGKTRLCGTHAEVPNEKGSWVSLEDKGEVIGAVLRTRQGVAPIYVSAGHKISLNSAIHYVMACVTRYKLPETTRAAHRLASGPA
ncbi:MAG: deoxyribonuclease V [Gammaproteobacteria bacterium]|nr:deoxyribonuclease V [Gammaproteobacteria bacterium]